MTEPRGDVILQIVPALEAGGAEQTALDIAAALASRGIVAPVACEGGRLVPALQAAGGEFVPFPAATKNPARIVANGLALARIVKARGVTLIHARSRAPAWSALIAARATGIPFVTTYHGAYNQASRLKAAYNGVMARGDAVIANSAYTERLILARHPFARGRVTVIPRGTDLVRFDPESVADDRVAALRAQWGVGDARIVLLAARLTQWKGQRVLIEAAALLRAQGLEDTVFVLAGDAQGRDEYRAGLEALIAARGLAGSVRIVGHCTDMPAALKAACVLAVPSTEPEAFGRSAVEAQAMGVAVVVTDHGAAPETVLAPPGAAEGSRTGWRVPPGDAAALASALRQALALDPDERCAHAARARAHAETFGLAAMSTATLAVYERLLHRPLRASRAFALT